jgi:hypothetical protein
MSHTIASEDLYNDQHSGGVLINRLIRVAESDEELILRVQVNGNVQDPLLYLPCIIDSYSTSSGYCTCTHPTDGTSEKVNDECLGR